MKSFFDFIGRIEASRGARRWSWIKKTTCSYPHLNNFIISLTMKKRRIMLYPPPLIRSISLFAR
ncbi:hypothetical protein [Mesobacillus jeotgali]|uniref:hypothetical protein n=1 Tax=Mesobacillus jeotgali TaxID=129985 RepID=UPI0013159093|nr:hypothetical protein [Mesobacillus jeotgali]